MDRRRFLQGLTIGGSAVALGAGWSMLGTATASAAESPYGPLFGPNGDGLLLPDGFTSRVVATTGATVGTTAAVWHGEPDGGATFPTDDGGWIYVSNSERSSGSGGVGAIEFDASGEIVAARTILSGTSRNCAGGPTPWGTWLSCEETFDGRVWECDPTGVSPAVVRPAMGRFQHEAAAVDPVAQVIYLTEDRADGGLYRFVPDAYPALDAGTLQVLVDAGGSLDWIDVPDPQSTNPATRHQVANTKRFDGGEGAWFHDGLLWFTTKGDGRVWTYDGVANVVSVVYDDSTAASPALTGVDNVTVADSGDVFVAEDGGNMEICVLVDDGAQPFLRLSDVSGSEITGPAFSPDGTRLYFSSQRTPGRTYEVVGPFRQSGGGGTTSTTTTIPPTLSAKTRKPTDKWYETSRYDRPTPRPRPIEQVGRQV